MSQLRYPCLRTQCLCCPEPLVFVGISCFNSDSFSFSPRYYRARLLPGTTLTTCTNTPPSVSGRGGRTESCSQVLPVPGSVHGLSASGKNARCWAPLPCSMAYVYCVLRRHKWITISRPFGSPRARKVAYCWQLAVFLFLPSLRPFTYSVTLGRMLHSLSLCGFSFLNGSHFFIILHVGSIATLFPAIWMAHGEA